MLFSVFVALLRFRVCLFLHFLAVCINFSAVLHSLLNFCCSWLHLGPRGADTLHSIWIMLSDISMSTHIKNKHSISPVATCGSIGQNTTPCLYDETLRKIWGSIIKIIWNKKLYVDWNREKSKAHNDMTKDLIWIRSCKDKYQLVGQKEQHS